jgi:hypothetical protein
MARGRGRRAKGPTASRRSQFFCRCCCSRNSHYSNHSLFWEEAASTHGTSRGQWGGQSLAINPWTGGAVPVRGLAYLGAVDGGSGNPGTAWDAVLRIPGQPIPASLTWWDWFKAAFMLCMHGGRGGSRCAMSIDWAYGAYLTWPKWLQGYWGYSYMLECCNWCELLYASFRLGRLHPGPLPSWCVSSYYGYVVGHCYCLFGLVYYALDTGMWTAMYKKHLHLPALPV